MANPTTTLKSPLVKEAEAPKIKLLDVTKLERGIVAIKDKDGNRILLKKFTQVPTGETPDFQGYDIVVRFQGKTVDDYMCHLSDWKPSTRTSATEDNLIASAVANGVSEEVARKMILQAKEMGRK